VLALRYDYSRQSSEFCGKTSVSPGDKMFRRMDCGTPRDGNYKGKSRQVTTNPRAKGSRSSIEMVFSP